MKYDLHTHTKYSLDGVIEPETLIKTGIKKGLDGIAVTDHDTIKGGVEAKKYEKDDFMVIVGSEIKTERGEIIGLFLEEEIKSKDVPGVVAEIKEQNGISIIPHPFDVVRKSALQPTDKDAKLVDCIEGFNSRCVLQKHNNKAVEFALKHNLTITAGSDAHFAWEIGNAFILAESSSEDELKRKILKNEINFKGKLSNPFNECMTKVLKTWRKAVK